MTRQEFLNRRAIANHVKTHGVTKVVAGQAHGIYPETVRARKVNPHKRADTHPITQERAHGVDPHTGESQSGVRRGIFK